MSLKRTLLLISLITSLIAATLIIIGLWVLVWKYMPDQKQKRPPIELNAEVRIVGAEVVVTNHDNFTYPHAVAGINPGWNTYYAGLGDIPPGKTKRVAVHNFATLSDERFNPFTTRISSIFFETCINGVKITYIDGQKMAEDICQ